MVTYTSSSTYWSPLRPRINIYAFNDSSYTLPLYTYNAFTDVGSEAKPIALYFDSNTTNVGNFSMEIEDSESTLDPDVYTRGNRVFIECSKDGITWQPAFKGLVRSCEQRLYASTGRNLVLEGYSYLIRLNERIVNTIEESSIIGQTYDRTDSTMFTKTLINDLLTTDSHYVNSIDDTQLYDIFKTNNITSSSIVDWIPRLDAQLITVSSAINKILDFSNGLVMFNPADDELMLYTADLVTPANNIFLLTNQSNENADDADYTMYPLEPYTYNVSYDYPESGSRLMASIGGAGVCPADNPLQLGQYHMDNGFYVSVGNPSYRLAPAVMFESSPIQGLYIIAHFYGDNSAGSSAEARVFVNSDPDGGSGTIGSQVGSTFNLYVDGVPGTQFPAVHTHAVILSQATGDIGPTVTPMSWYYLSVNMTHTMDTQNRVSWWTEAPVALDGSSAPGRAYFWHIPNGGPWSGANSPLPGNTTAAGVTAYKYAYGVTSNVCGGSQASAGADPVFAIAHDRNMSGRLGVVERVISGVPTHVKTAQTLNEYLYNQLYFAAKPRFTFSFPSVSMPNRVPKAGDIIAHVDSRVNVGLQNSPIQTGVINSIAYSFEQGRGKNDALGLRRFGLTTTGIKRGSY